MSPTSSQMSFMYVCMYVSMYVSLCVWEVGGIFHAGCSLLQKFVYFVILYPVVSHLLLELIVL